MSHRATGPLKAAPRWGNGTPTSNAAPQSRKRRPDAGNSARHRKRHRIAKMNAESPEDAPATPDAVTTLEAPDTAPAMPDTPYDAGRTKNSSGDA